MRQLEILERESKDDFKKAVENFYFTHDVRDVKFQRNLYYAGIGSSAGATPGAAPLTPETKLSESYVAFLLYEEYSPRED